MDLNLLRYYSINQGLNAFKWFKCWMRCGQVKLERTPAALEEEELIRQARREAAAAKALARVQQAGALAALRVEGVPPRSPPAAGLSCSPVQLK